MVSGDVWLRSTLLALLVFLTLVGVVLLVALSSDPAEAATTFIVNKTSDAKDRKLSDTVCDTSRKKGKQCTLRAAIQESNDTSGADTINFNIGGTAGVKTINVGSTGLEELPAITEAVTINGYTQRGAKENTLAEGNNAVLKIQLNGTNAGTFADGLLIGASNSTIKGLVINRFGENGIYLPNVLSGLNNIEGNFIGTSASGTTDLGNQGNGVEIFEASNNTIGGTAPAQRNVISGNNDRGIYINQTIMTVIQGNHIGTKADGTGDLGNANEGVRLGFDGFEAAHDTIIGGTATGAGNVISGNGGEGVEIMGFANKVEGNTIQANGGHGVSIGAGSNNTVGDVTAEAGNVISGNGGDGVAVSGGSTSNRILFNSIFSNTNLGIDLGDDGVTQNDVDPNGPNDDSDTGANNRQNFPLIGSAIRSSSTTITTIIGTLNSSPDQNYIIQCFVTDGAPAGGHGEGKTFLGQTTTATNSNGDATFTCAGPDPTLGESTAGKTVTATATNNTATGDTSEFSQNVQVASGT
jgi:hypothetical protein